MPMHQAPQLKDPLPASSLFLALVSGQRGTGWSPHPKGLNRSSLITPLALTLHDSGLGFPVNANNSELIYSSTYSESGPLKPFNTYTH